MLIRRRNRAWLGMLMGISFFVVLILFCAPVFTGYNNLERSDRLFNRLAKGSSYFIPALSSSVRQSEERNVAVDVEMENPQQAAQARAVLAQAAPATTVRGPLLSISGNLAHLLRAALKDCDAMYLNHPDELKARYGIDGKDTLLVWFTTLNAIARKLQQGSPADIAQSRLILAIVARGIEPAYNFYGIQPETVGRRGGVTAFLLAFYLVYTVWWGFAIYFMCEGCGLAMTRARVRREV